MLNILIVHVPVWYLCVCWWDRLHKEALKQAAVDPSTGKIDVSILTTGISGAVRKQRADRAMTLLELIKAKGKVLVLKYNKLYEEFREKVIEKGEQVWIVASEISYNLSVKVLNSTCRAEQGRSRDRTRFLAGPVNDQMASERWSYISFIMYFCTYIRWFCLLNVIKISRLSHCQSSYLYNLL